MLLDMSTPPGLELHLDLFGKYVQVLLLEVPKPQRPELHKDVPNIGPELHLDCLTTEATTASGLVYATEGA